MLMQLFSLSRFDVKSPCDNGTERCWCFLSCVTDMSGPVAKSINAVNAGLPSKPGWGPEHGANHPAGTTVWCGAA